MSNCPKKARDIKLTKSMVRMVIWGCFLKLFESNGYSTYMLMINPMNQAVSRKGPPHAPVKAQNPVMLHNNALTWSLRGRSGFPTWDLTT